MKRRNFLKALCGALAAVSFGAAAKKQEVVELGFTVTPEDILRLGIEKLFDYVHPVRGDKAYFQDADGQNKYTTYALASDKDTPEIRRWLTRRQKLLWRKAFDSAPSGLLTAMDADLLAFELDALRDYATREPDRGARSWSLTIFCC